MFSGVQLHITNEKLLSIHFFMHMFEKNEPKNKIGASITIKKGVQNNIICRLS